MIYKTKIPSPMLGAFVESLWYWKAEGVFDNSTPIKIHIPPGGRIELVFNLGTRCEIELNNNIIKSNHSIISGIRKELSVYNFLSAPHFVGIKFKPGAFSFFFGIPISEVGENPTLMSDVFGSEVEILTESLYESDSIESKFAIIENWLLKKYVAGKSSDAELQNIIEQFMKPTGAGLIKNLCANSDSRYKKIQRAFNYNVGHSPKSLARILRFYNIRNEVVHSEKPDWMGIVEKYDFHDQSHLIKEFQFFSGLSPNEFHESNFINTNFFKKYS